MTNAELGTICTAIVTGLGGLGVVVKWVGNSIVAAVERSRAATDRAVVAYDRNSDALLKFTETAVRLEAIVVAGAKAHEATKERVEDLVEEVTGTHDIPSVIVDGLEDDSESNAVPSRITPAKGITISVMGGGKRKATRS